MSDGSADVDVPSNRRPTRTLSTTRRGAGIEAITKEVLSARTGAYGELDQIAPRSSRVMEVQEFVAAAEVDPVYLDASYATARCLV
jgi:hypothetical protein